MASDPVEIVAKAMISEAWLESVEPEQDRAWFLLDRLHAAGWRVIRDDGPCPHPGSCPCEQVRITDEWLPDKEGGN